MRKYLIILGSEGAGSLRRLEVRGWFVLCVALAAALFVAANLALFVWNMLHLPSGVCVERMRRERDSLREFVGVLEARLDSLSRAFDYISTQSDKLCELAGVSLPNRSYAVGGPQLVDPERAPQRFDLALRIDSLLFVARQEIAALDSVQQKLALREKILRHTPSISPMRGFFSSGFGMRLDPLTGQWRMHEGIDICAPKGTPVHATADGVVKFAGWQHGFGKVVCINHIWFETRYAHLDRILVRRGQRVRRGDVIGTCGRTGRTTGVHLHYEVRIAGKPVDPKDYILPQTVCVD